MRKPVWVLAVVGLVGVLGAILAVPGGADGPPAPSPVAALRAQLDAHGFVVQDGLTSTVSAIELVDEHLIGSASGNNAGQAYKVTAVPPYPASGQRPGPPFPVFQLRPDEAIVYVGPTPPRGDYFSFTPFLVTRYLHSTIPKGDWLFASLGDPLNNVLIKTQGPGDPFHKNTIVIFTADRGVYQRIEQSARAAGYQATQPR